MFMEQLHSLAASSQPLPPADYARHLASAGLAWRPRKVSMLKRTSVLKLPQVWALIHMLQSPSC